MAEKPVFSWKKNVWKGARPALVAALAAFVIAFVPDAGTLADFGVPSVLSVLIFEAGRNWMREHGYIKK